MATVTITLAAPTTRKDGSPLALSDIASVDILRTNSSAAPTKIATVHAPIAATFTYADLNVAPGSYGYANDVVDTLTQVSDASDTFPETVAAPPAAPNPAVIVSVTVS